MDAATLDACTGCGLMVANTWATPLSTAMARASVTTPLRQAAFLAQVGHESSGFNEIEENLNYSADGLLAVFPNEFDASSAAAYSHNPERIANRAYAGKNGNGDEASGDGWAFRGRGLVQLTGRTNYAAFGNWYGRYDFIKHPSLLIDYLTASLAAAFFWNEHALNVLADTQDFRAITRQIVGRSMEGEDARESRYAHARAALAIARWNPLG